MKTIIDWIVKILIVITWIGFCFWVSSTLTGCSHTKKAFSELSRKVDSVFVKRSDTSFRNKKDSSNTVIDLHGIDIFWEPNNGLDDSRPSLIQNGITNIGDNLFIEGISKQLNKAFPNKKPVHVHIDSATIGNHTTTTINSGKVSKTDSVHVKSEEKQKTKTVDRKGTNLGSTIFIWALIIAAIIGVVLYFKSKIPFIKNL